MVDVVADPRLVGVLAPTNEVGVGEVRGVLDAQRLLQGTCDDGDTALGHDGVPAEDGGHVDNQHGATTVRAFERSRDASDAGSDDDDVRRA